MLNEIIKTAEELNTAALYYRQSGNMDGVRELAKLFSTFSATAASTPARRYSSA